MRVFQTGQAILFTRATMTSDIPNSNPRGRIDRMTSRYPIYLIDDDDTVREGLSLLFRASDMAVLTFVDAN
ncbi:hypothetical protein, partial [Providencia rettgeri]|uniref:hypothetical protein n=1 Tax=Providencia rettgeri TaxID=587 RepID=UPI0029DB46C1